MSGIQKNVAGQKWTVFVFNRTNNQPVLGDAANITAKLRKDWGVPAATNDVNPTEVEDGYYDFDLTQTEVNADQLHLLPESATADIQVIALPAVIFTEAPNYNAKAVSALNDLAQSNILSDATPFAGANVDATVSSRSNHAAADIWSVATRELTSNANLNDPTAVAIRDAILDRVLPLNHDLADTVGAFLQQLDAAISSRSSHAAPDLSNLDVAVSTRSSHSEITVRDAILNRVLSGNHDSPDTPGALLQNVDALVSSRSNHAAADIWSVGTRTLTAFSFTVDSNVVQFLGSPLSETNVADIANNFSQFYDVNPTTTNTVDDVGAGSGGGFWSTAEQENIRYRLQIDGTQAAPAVDAGAQLPSESSNMRGTDGASTHSAVDVRTEVDANSTQLASIVGDTNELQSDWANGGRLDLILDSRASQASIDALNDPTVEEIADGVWDEARAGHAIAGSFGEFIDAAVSSRSSHAAPDVSNLDVAVSTRSSHSAPDVSNLDVAVSTRSSHSAPDLSNLDTLVSSRATPAEVKAQADQALVDIHLDHLLAVAYDATAKPGAADALLNEMVEDDTGVTRYTANALEQAPSGGGGGGNVTVEDLTQAALAKFANTDTGEITAIAGSVAKLSQASGGTVGAGAIEWEILVNDAQGNPISDVAVWITTDELGSNVVAGTLYTDDFGKVTFMLDAGTYYSWKDHSAFNFNNPTEFTVA